MTVAEQLIAAGAPLWITIAAIITPMLMTFSKAAGNIPGVLGSASRWWHTRQIREVERAESLDKAIEEAVSRRVESEIAPIRDRMQRMEERLRVAEEEVALRDEYILEVAEWTRSVQEEAAEKGFVLPSEPPKPPRFSLWVIDRRRREGDAPKRE